ncbi:MAG: cytochrome c [Paracoccaceae bacterium]|jgi:cytochrome c
MFDTMTVTKVGGALCGALLIFLLLNWAGDIIYSTETGGHGDHAEAAYLIEIEDEDDSHDDDSMEEAIDVAALVASADAVKGAKVFTKCKACHKVEPGVNSTGPSLYGIVGKDVASEGGFKYSSAITGIDGNWTIEALNDFLLKPKDMVPGTKMSFAGLKKDNDRANLIAYLQTLTN